MPAKKANAKGPGKPGRVAPHKALSPGTLEAAQPGNRQGLADAYGEASAWLRDGKAPPRELAEWIGNRLLALARVLHDDHDKRMHGVPAALWLVEPGKRGNKGLSSLELRQRADLVLDVMRQRQKSKCTLPEAYERVAAMHVSAGHYITPVQVAAAWKARNRLSPLNPETDS